jgi:hypothetical protein
MDFIKNNKKTIGLAVTFLVGGLAAIGYDIPAPLVSLVLSAFGVN